MDGGRRKAATLLAVPVNETGNRFMSASLIRVVALAVLLPMAVSAEPACKFANTEHRRINGDNPDDFRCIQLLAKSDEHWQFYYGLILVGQVAGPKDVQKGLEVLQQVARRNNKYSANAMVSLGTIYKRPAFKNHELAYQWLYLASRQPAYKGTEFPLPDEELNASLSQKRRAALEQTAPKLIQRLE
jgi:hypothetical protein